MKILQNKTISLLGNYVENLNDTASSLKKLRVLNTGQIHDCQATVLAYQCWNDLYHTVFTDSFAYIVRSTGMRLGRQIICCSVPRHHKCRFWN